MTSTPASRSARATTLAPRSCPSRPTLATTTRMLPMAASHRHRALLAEGYPAVSGFRRLQLLDRGVPQDQMLHPMLTAEIDLRFGPFAPTTDAHHGAKAERIMGDPVAGRQRRHLPVACHSHAWAGGHPFAGWCYSGRGLLAPPVHQLRRDLGKKPRGSMKCRAAPPGAQSRAGQVQPLPCPGDPDVGEPTLLFHSPCIGHRPLVREHAFL